MRLARGSGVDGLSGMAPVQKLETAAGDLQILRPFLETDPHFWPVLCEGPNLTGLKTPAIWTINLSGCVASGRNMLNGLGLRARALARTAAI